MTAATAKKVTIIALFTVLHAFLFAPYALAQVESAVEEDDKFMLKLPIPKNYKLGYEAKNSINGIREWVPEGQTVDNWSRMITHSFQSLPNVSAEYFYQGAGNKFIEKCKGATVTKPRKFTIKGFEAVLADMSCGQVPGTSIGEYNIFLYISYPKGVQILQLSQRIPAYDASKYELPKELSDEWGKFISITGLCKYKGKYSKEGVQDYISIGEAANK